MLTETAFAAYVKRKFDPKYINNMYTAKQSKMWKSAKKSTDGGGDFLTYLEDADDLFGASPDFTVSQNQAANQSPTQGSQFQFAWTPLYEVARLDTPTINKTRNTDSAWQSAITVAMKKKLAAVAHYNAVIFQGQGWGEICQITNPVGSTFQCLVASDITKIVQGMPVVFSADLNVSALRSATIRTVLAVDYSANLVTLDGTLAGVSAVANDFAFIAGARQNAGSPARLTFVGFGAHVPDRTVALTDTTVITLGGVNRANNSRLYGTFVDARTAGSALSAMIDGVQEASTIGGAEHIEMFASKNVFAGVAKDLQNGVNYEGNPGDKSVGTKRLHIFSDGDGCDAYLNVDKVTNDNQIWGFDPQYVNFRSIGEAPMIDNFGDKNQMGRVSNAAAWELRLFQQAALKISNHPACLRIRLV